MILALRSDKLSSHCSISVLVRTCWPGLSRRATRRMILAHPSRRNRQACRCLVFTRKNRVRSRLLPHVSSLHWSKECLLAASQRFNNSVWSYLSQGISQIRKKTRKHKTEGTFGAEDAAGTSDGPSSWAMLNLPVPKRVLYMSGVRFMPNMIPRNVRDQERTLWFWTMRSHPDNHAALSIKVLFTRWCVQKNSVCNL